MMLARDSQQFRTASAILDSVFPEGTLPKLVFPGYLSDYCWLEFEEMLADEFWACLRQCGQQAMDTHIIVRSLYQFPDDNFGCSGMAQFEPSATADEYSEFLDCSLKETPEISIRNVGDRFQIVGDNKRWAFYGDRDVELLVGAHLTGMTWPIVAGVRYHTFETALQLAGASYRGHTPTGMYQAYEDNYRAGTWHITKFVEG